jgi:hypothetical protein
MRTSRWLALLTLVLFAGALGTAQLATARGEIRWKLKVEPALDAVRNPVGRLAVKPEKGGEQVYWYVVYTVTNRGPDAVPMQINLSARSDASDESFNEGYYPRALAKIRQRFGDDVMDNVALNGHVLESGQSVRGVAVFQLFEPAVEGEARAFEERVDRLIVSVDGYADPVKRNGLESSIEKLRLEMHFEKRGDQFDPARETVRYRSSEEHVVGG